WLVAQFLAPLGRGCAPDFPLGLVWSAAGGGLLAQFPAPRIPACPGFRGAGNCAGSGGPGA
ncbi:hypothetical protein, partial [Streptomyces sp. NPDC096311]|uniref:hypothetical protein n=1 Tax=Streptomyces sp. NPDC096311 TaxID=3366083 RepID=UPI00382BD078